MTWVAVAVASVLAAVTTLATPTVLRRIPEPTDDPDAAAKTRYAALPTAPFLLVVAGLAWASGLVAFGVTAPAAWLAWASLAGPGALVIVVDGVTTWLPRVLTRTIAVVATVGLVTWATVEADPLVAVRGGLGALGVGGLFYLFWRVTGGIGFGDVRLMAVVGAVTAAHSVQLTIWAVLAGTIAGAAWGLARRILKGPGAFAYGPALWLGPFLALWVAGPGFPAGA